MRRVLACAGLAVALLCVAATGAGASLPDGPRLAFTRWSLKPFWLEIVSTDPVGGAAQSIALGSRRRLPLPMPFLGPAWSADGEALAFTGISQLPPRGGDGKPKLDIFLVGSDGSGLRAVPGTQGGYEPVFSPDGHTLAFTRVRERTRKNRRGGRRGVYESASVWLADLTTGSVVRLTGWRNRLVNVASSFSPDGSVLAVSRRGGDGRWQAIALHLDGSGSTLISANGYAPKYSPDGSRVALLRDRRRVFRRRSRQGRTIVERTTASMVADLFVMGTDGSGLRRVTSTPRASESAASWDPSGQRLAYTASDATSLDGLLGYADTIMEVNADGSCPTPVLSDPDFAFYGPAWRPGAARAAARIPC